VNGDTRKADPVTPSETLEAVTELAAMREKEEELIRNERDAHRDYISFGNALREHQKAIASLKSKISDAL
jgi:hypothetical protein